MKKITKKISILLSIILACSLFSACNLFSRDDKRDLTIEVATIQVEAKSVDKENITSKFPATKINILKGDLYLEIQQSGQGMIDNGSTYEEATESSLDNLIQRELVFLNVAQLIHFKDIVWRPLKNELGDTYDENNATHDIDDFKKDLTNDNELLKAIYKSIDSQLTTIINQILTERNEDKLPDQGSGSTTPTFPVQPNEKDDIVLPQFRLYEPKTYPGVGWLPNNNTPSNDFASLQKEAFKRFLNQLQKSIDEDYRVDDNQKQAYTKKINDKKAELIKADKDSNENTALVYKKVYFDLGTELVDAINKDIDTTSVDKGKDSVLFLSFGKEAFRTQVLNSLQNSLKDKAKSGVTDNRITKYYDDLLSNQKRLFDSNEDKFTETLDSDSVVLYNPTNKYFFVKHILVEFSEEQKAQLENIKKTGNFGNFSDYESFRENFTKNIRTYPIIDGEEFKDNGTMTDNQIGTEINSIIKPLVGHGYQSSNAMDKLIYKYNRDSGLFGKIDKGYLVKPAQSNDPDKDGIDPQWQPEFGRAAKNLREEYDKDKKIGNIERCVTDFGVHYVYLSDVIDDGQKSLTDYTTKSLKIKVYDAIKTTLQDQDANKVFTNWQNDAVNQYLNANSNAVTKFTNRYKDIWSGK